MSVIKITSKEQFLDQTKTGTVLIDFKADWCGPCKMLSPIVGEIASENTQIKVLEVDVDQNQDIASDFMIMSIPTLIVFKDGVPASKLIGFNQKEKILELIK